MLPGEPRRAPCGHCTPGSVRSGPEWTGVARDGPGRRADNEGMRTDAPFEWLLEKRCRRSALLDVEHAIRTGRLDGTADARRAELVRVLRRLMRLPDLAPRELARMVTVARLLANAELLAELRSVEAVVGRPPRRRARGRRSGE